MSVIIINLSFNRRDLEAIYFGNNQGNPILSLDVRTEIISFLLCLSFFFISIIYTTYNESKSWLILISAVLTILSFIPYFIKVRSLIAWKTSVLRFLKQNEIYVNHRLEITDHSITLVQDDTKHIYTWSAFSSAQISDSYISFSGKENFIFPYKSMRHEEYEQLKSVVIKHLKAGDN